MCQKIIVGNVSLLSFVENDMDVLYEIRNHDSVRMGLSDQGKISYSSHVSWVKENILELSNVKVFIAQSDKGEKGMVLLKNISHKTAEMGIMVKYARQQLNSLFVSKLMCGILFYSFEELRLPEISMNITHENKESYDLAKKIGATETNSNETYVLLKLSRQNYNSLWLHKMMNRRYRPRVIG